MSRSCSRERDPNTCRARSAYAYTRLNTHTQIHAYSVRLRSKLMNTLTTTYQPASSSARPCAGADGPRMDSARRLDKSLATGIAFASQTIQIVAEINMEIVAGSTPLLNRAKAFSSFWRSRKCSLRDRTSNNTCAKADSISSCINIHQGGEKKT